MSSLCSHAVSWEMCGHNPISSGIPVGAGGKRVQALAFASAQNVKKRPCSYHQSKWRLVRRNSPFGTSCSCFWIGALGTRRGELGALRWSDCNFDSMSFCVQHSYYWRRGGQPQTPKAEAAGQELPTPLAPQDAFLGLKYPS